MDDFSARLFSLLLAIPAIVAGLTIHEFAHAWTAYKLGDDTAQRMGRVTLDPVAHLDPLGSLFFLFVWFSGFGLGWAKPVPVQVRNFENPRRDNVLVSIAGPVSNLLQVPFWMLALLLVRMAASANGQPMDGNFIESVVNDRPNANSMFSVLSIVCSTGITINIMLAAFNMIPIPPLDGHWVLEALGPPSVTDFYNAIRPFSIIILLVVLQAPILGDRTVAHVVLAPFMNAADALVILTLGDSPSAYT